jgi:hypothetical protein
VYDFGRVRLDLLVHHRMPFDPGKGSRHMSTLTIEIPDDILIPTGQSREGFIQEAKFLLAAKLFELGRLSSGRAAELCGMAG